MPNAAVKNVITWFLILMWPIISFLIFTISISLSPSQKFSYEFDQSFFIKLVLILITHMLAFGIVPLLILYLSGRTNRLKFGIIIITGGMIVIVQSVLRMLGNFSLQSEDMSVMPNKLHGAATVITIATLISLYVIFILLLYRKNKVPA